MPETVSPRILLCSGLLLFTACSATPEPETPCPKPEPMAGRVVCPPGTETSGDTCIRNEVRTVVQCPPGSHFEGTECRAQINPECPAGMAFQAGTGCVPLIVQAPAAVAVATAAPAGNGKCPSGMATVAGGSFVLGGYQTSSGQTTTVSSFCLDLTEVTVGAYKACVNKGTCPTAKLACNPDSATWGAGDDKLPLNCIDYTDSATYCASVGKRMPTEDEWEWAARGGAQGRKYPWGANEDWSKLCASTPNKRTLPCKVGSFTGGDTPLGIHDMAGSLWEWATTTRPSDNSKPTDMAIRGGGWDIVVGFPSFASGSRVGYETTYRSKAVGFRCAKTP